MSVRYRPTRLSPARTDQGTVERGRNADLVLPGANPVADVRNLHAIQGVVRDGRYYSEADLAAIKASVHEP